MNCLVELYNEDRISSLVAVLSFRPRKVVLIYDGSDDKLRRIENLKEACVYKNPDLIFEHEVFKSADLGSTVDTFSSVIHRNPGCYLNITGASELGAIGAYLACAKNFVPIFKLNLRKNRIENIKGCKLLENEEIPNIITASSLFLANGASISGNTHPIPPLNMYSNILSFCDLIFEKIEEWKKLCCYLQTGKNRYPQTDNVNLFWAPKKIKDTKLEVAYSDESFLVEAEKLGLIYSLDICDETVSFCFMNEISKRYFTDFGGWLELYCYIKLIQSQRFRDVRISVKINWENNLYDFVHVINEIDVVFFYKNRPCFLSCKIAEPTSVALQELCMYTSFFGGKYSKVILVTLAKIDKKFSKFYKRASNMGVLVIDGNDLKDFELANLIEQSL